MTSRHGRVEYLSVDELLERISRAKRELAEHADNPECCWHARAAATQLDQLQWLLDGRT